MVTFSEIKSSSIHLYINERLSRSQFNNIVKHGKLYSIRGELESDYLKRIRRHIHYHLDLDIRKNKEFYPLEKLLIYG